MGVKVGKAVAANVGVKVAVEVVSVVGVAVGVSVGASVAAKGGVPVGVGLGEGSGVLLVADGLGVLVGSGPRLTMTSTAEPISTVVPAGGSCSIMLFWAIVTLYFESTAR